MKKDKFFANDIKLSMVEPVGGHGGNEFYDFGLCEELLKLCEVNFYTCDETNLHNQHDLKTPTYSFYRGIYGDDSALLRGVRYLYGALKSALHARRHKSNIAHFHIYHFAWREFLNLLAFKIMGMRIVATVHDVESFSSDAGMKGARKSYQKFSWLVDQYIVHSTYAHSSMLELAGPDIEKKLHVVAHGDTDFIYKKAVSKRDARSQLGLPQDKRLILFFGQIKRVKGVDVLIDAFAELANENPDIELLIVGKPWKVDGELIQSRIRDYGINSRVILNMSYVKNENVPLYFAAADLVVLPYLKIYSSGVVLRTLDYGAPVVVSDLGPLVDIITDGDNGRVFRAGDSGHLKQVIDEVIHDDKTLQLFVEAGKKTIEQGYSWKVVSEQTLNIYRKALDQQDV